jgi:hypothetical protein
MGNSGGAGHHGMALLVNGAAVPISYSSTIRRSTRPVHLYMPASAARRRSSPTVAWSADKGFESCLDETRVQPTGGPPLDLALLLASGARETLAGVPRYGTTRDVVVVGHSATDPVVAYFKYDRSKSELLLQLVEIRDA